MKIRIIAFSGRGCELGAKVCGVLGGHECRLYSKTSADIIGIEKAEGSVSDWTREAFSAADAILFIGAAGIAVRCISLFVKNKTEDPAVISIDEKGQFVIPLLSGHIGGANDLARYISGKIGAVPVITTATDIHGKFSVDSYAGRHNMHIGSMLLAKEISSVIVSGGKIGLISDVPISGSIPPELDLNGKEDLGVFISYGRCEGPFAKTLKLTPRCHVLGIGCRRGISADSIGTLVNEVLERENISPRSVKAVASIDIKSNEAGLLEFSERMGIKPIFFSPDELGSIPDMEFTPSDTVKSVTGVDNVCERAAYAASRSGEIITRKTAKDGVTLAIVREPFSADLTEG
ncbi:MAG: cobalt-precorrin 5A hydrolase [Candidatus Methanoplasma sp.]|jgi:cobalt-precorrin 5A hydrolase|nr:cobalt-precorrin 5A hydrolase [Candidatus Methanoplasma sp.]